MFERERDMISVLQTELSSMYQTNSFVQELRSGNGVVDLAFTTGKCQIHKTWELDYQAIHFLTEVVHNKQQELTVDIVAAELSLSKRKASFMLKELVNAGYLHNVKGIYKVKKKYKATLKDIISIEAKIKDWKQGLSQAMRYQFFSNKCYLALSSQYIHRVDVELIRSQNIGLISVYPDYIEILHHPPKKPPINPVSFNFVSERFVSLMHKQTQCN